MMLKVPGSRSSGLRRPLYFKVFETSSAISAACAWPNSLAAHNSVNSASFSFGQRAGLRARLKKNSVGNSIGFRSPTFTIQMRLAPYSKARCICSQTFGIGFVSIHL